MKKFYAIFGAALISVCSFASIDQVPSDAILADYYDQGNVCLCFFVPANMACNDIVITGSFNGWSSTVDNCAPVEAVEGYDGWHVASFTPENEPSEVDGISAKPIMLDIDGNFNWEFQIGAATTIRGAVQVIQGPYAGEIDLKHFGTDAPNVFTVDAWKQNPCTRIYHNYNVTVVSAGCDGSVVPFIVGSMNGWTFQQLQYNSAKTAANDGVPTYDITFKAAEGTPYQIVSGKLGVTGEIEVQPGWYEESYMQMLVDDEWVRIQGEDGDNQLTHENANIVWNLSVDTLRWARCEENSSIKIGDLYYNLDNGSMTAEVTYRGSSYSSYSDEYSGVITIPTSVTHRGNAFYVTSIGYSAFYGCSGLTSVTIGDSVKNIDNYAFYECSGLTSVTIGNKVTRIGNQVFFGCSGLTSVTIPNSVISIGRHAFRGCTGLTSATIGNNVTIIEDFAFRGCTGLTSVTIGNSVTSIGNSAFYGCDKIAALTIPDSVQTIASSAFRNCTMLQNLTLGTSVNSIGSAAFAYCPYLIDIQARMALPPIIDANVFIGCGDLSGITLNVPQHSLAQYQKTDVWKEFNLHGDNDNVTDYTITFRDKDAGILESEFISIAVPDAPVIDGFTFVKWQVVAGDLENGIDIQAVYTSNTPTSTPSMFVNPANPTQKLIREGNVYILRDGKTYTVEGQEVK